MGDVSADDSQGDGSGSFIAALDTVAVLLLVVIGFQFVAGLVVGLSLGPVISGTSPCVPHLGLSPTFWFEVAEATEWAGPFTGLLVLLSLGLVALPRMVWGACGQEKPGRARTLVTAR